MKKILLLLIIIISVNHLFAQSNPKLKELMNNASITWIGEYETYFPFDILNISSLNDSMSSSAFWDYSGYGSNYRAQDIYSEKFQSFLGVDMIKIEKIKQMWSIYSRDEDGLSPGPFHCNHLLYQWVRSGKLKAYHDADLTKVLEKKELEMLGKSEVTVQTVDTETFEEVQKVEIIDLKPENLQLNKAKFYIYFNNLNKTWNIYTQSIAVLANSFDENDNFKGYENLFWIPVENDTIAYDYTEAIYPEVRRSAVQIAFNKAKIVKQVKSAKETNDSLLIEVRKTKSKKFISFLVAGDMITEYEQINIGIKKDTFLVNDPATYEEKSAYLEKIYNGEDIINVRFVQDWYWDENLKKLKVNYVYYAPIINLNNINIKVPLFYEKMMKTKFDKLESKKK